MKISGATLDYLGFFPSAGVPALALSSRHQVKDDCKQGAAWESCGETSAHLSTFHHLELDKEPYSFQICKYIKLLMSQMDYEFLE